MPSLEATRTATLGLVHVIGVSTAQRHGSLEGSLQPICRSTRAHRADTEACTPSSDDTAPVCPVCVKYARGVLGKVVDHFL